MRQLILVITLALCQITGRWLKNSLPIKIYKNMKKILILGSFLICTLCKAQFTLSVGGGYSFNKTGVAEAHCGYNTGPINFSGGFQAHTSDRVSKGVVLQLRAGHDFNMGDFQIQPFAGYGYHYLSADIKWLNSNQFLYGGQFSKDIRTRNDDHLRLYLAGTKTGDYKFITIGVMGIFDNN